MKPYPYLLCRIGTLDYNLLESISWKGDTVLTRYSGLQQQLESVTQRKPKDSDAIKKARQELADFEKEFEKVYLTQQYVHRAAFSALAGNPLLQKGLLQSSPDLWQSVQRYRLQSPSLYRKKERQTERALALYLARICTKTSPFSTFTALSINDLSGKSLIQGNPLLTSTIHVNNYVLAQLEELLAAYPPCFRQLAVVVNPLLEEEGEQYCYLLNSRNVESIQRVEKNAVLAVILEEIKASEAGAVLFRDLLFALCEKVAASEEELESYLAELVRLGLLNWCWPVSGTTTNWNENLITWLENLSPFEGHKLLLAAMKQLQETRIALPLCSAEKRWPLIQQSMENLTSCFREIASLLPQKENPSQDVFVSFQQSEFTLKPERLFFEDSRLVAEINWSEAALKAIMEELATLTALMMPFRLYEEEERLTHFFKTHYQQGAVVPLMRFYEDFYHSEREAPEQNTPPVVEKILALREAFANKLSEQINIDNNFNVHLPLTLLSKIAASLPMTMADAPGPKSFGALLQLQRSSDGQYKSYIDAVFTGYGKMLGRFLHLFPERFTLEASNYLDELRADALWVDISDASFHNANVHPPLLDKMLVLPGAQHHSPLLPYPPPARDDKNNIAITNLEVLYNEAEDRLGLSHHGQAVTVFNFGLEALSSRSPMYRLLSTFCLPQPDLTALKVILTGITRVEKDGWIHFPRVNIGHHLILQRRAWYLPLSELPLRKNAETQAAYFLRIQQWRLQHQLPQRLFITLSPIEVNSNEKLTNTSFADSGDLYKPQYIDFAIPALISHFGRALVYVNTMLKMEEFLPGEAEMVEVNGKKRAAELVVQWEGG
jgi:lantibiotic biosynthesis protein